MVWEILYVGGSCTMLKEMGKFFSNRQVSEWGNAVIIFLDLDRG